MRKGLQTFSVSFDEARLTHFGGLVLIQRFCQRLHLRRRLSRCLRQPQRRGDYAPADLVLALLFAVMVRLRGLNKTEVLHYNGALQVLLGLGYVIVACEYRRIKARARAARFQTLRQGRNVAEFSYTPTGCKTPHRFVVVRRPLPADPLQAKQLTLSCDRRYAYHVLATNLALTPWRVWRFYCPHATVEKNIRELLYDLPLGKIPTEDWLTNVAFFQLVLLVYDLARWFKRLCLPPAYLTASLETLCTDLLALRARLVRWAGRNVLRLPRDYPHRTLLRTAWQRAGPATAGCGWARKRDFVREPSARPTCFLRFCIISMPIHVFFEV